MFSTLPTDAARSVAESAEPSAASVVPAESVGAVLDLVGFGKNIAATCS